MLESNFNMQIKKKCGMCGEEKDVSEFNLRGGKRQGYQSYCKRCVYNYQLEKVVLNGTRKYPGRRKYNLITRYKITESDYDKMLNEQNGVCAICGKAPDENKHLYVDHNHVTGKVRGLLCNSCNYKLGIIENKSFVEFYQSTIEYLTKTND